MIAVVRLWLDHPQVGCGWRQYVVAQLGRKWVRLVVLATGQSIRIARSAYDGAKPQPIPKVSARRTASRLRRNAQTHGYEKSASVKAALAVLRESRA